MPPTEAMEDITYAGMMTRWVDPAGAKAPIFGAGVDVVTTATPLAYMKTGEVVPYSVGEVFIGPIGGSMGETSALLLLIGFGYLLLRKVISARIPVAFIGTVFVLALVKGGFMFGLAEILAGGVFLGAIFMATDYVTTPINKYGKMVFAFGCGLITVFIRYFGGYPEGVSFAILIMNILVPYIDKLTKHKVYGGKKA